MGDFIVFDGGLRRVRSTSALRKPVQSTRNFNQFDIHRIVGSYYGGLPISEIVKHANMSRVAIENVIRNNSRPVDIEPLPIAHNLRSAA